MVEKTFAAKIHGDQRQQQVKNSNQFDKCNQNTHFFRFLSLSQRSISRWQTPTQGQLSIISAAITGVALGKEGGREISFPPSGLRVIMRS